MNNQPFLRSDEYRWQVDPRNPKRPIKGPALKSLKNFSNKERILVMNILKEIIKI
jgi:hypothetical protein